MLPLFVLATERVHLVWSGPEAPSDASASDGVLRAFALRTGADLRIEREGEQVGSTTSLRLAEQTRYRLFVRSLTDAPVVLRHDDPLATQDLVSNEQGRILSGSVDFEGQVGQSRFVVAVGGEEEFAFEVEVFPTKASSADVEAMRLAIDSALSGLAFEYLRSTTTQAEHVAWRPQRATWLTLLRRALPDLEAALDAIAARPHRDLRRDPQLVRSDRVRRADAGLRRAVQRGRGAGHMFHLRSTLPVRAYLPERRAIDTLDTAEHRWLRMRIDAARATIAAIQRDEAQLPRSDRRCKVLADLADAERRLARLVRLAPLAAPTPCHVPAPTPRLLTAPGYAEAYRAANTVSFSLRLANGAVPHATRDLHLLYEMWCYLTVVEHVAQRLGQPVSPSSFFRADSHGIRLMLRRGHRHGVTFEDGAREVQVVYNPRFAARPGLLAQRPDILLTISEKGAVRRYVLDAKYRRDETAGYVRRYGAPGPPENALGDLHRYRDAIVESTASGVARNVVQALALYPYREPRAGALKDTRLWTTAATVGVGAIPLLPGATSYLDRWLVTVLG